MPYLELAKVHPLAIVLREHAAYKPVEVARWTEVETQIPDPHFAPAVSRGWIRPRASWLLQVHKASPLSAIGRHIQRADFFDSYPPPRRI